MQNKYEDIQEAVLKSAFKDAMEQNIAELEAMDIEICRPTKEQRREIERLAHKAERKASGRGGRVWRAVAMVAIVCCLGCGLLMMQPNVRASVWDVVVSFFEKYFTFGANSDAPSKEYDLGAYTIQYVPEGYAIADREEYSIMTVLSFNNKQEDLLIILYKTSFNQANGDNENAIVKAVTVGNLDGYLAKEPNTGIYKLVWGDENHTFTIKASISEKEILKIAKNIR